jgi:hypothetical protein
VLRYAFYEKKVCAEIAWAFTLWGGSLAIKQIVNSVADTGINVKLQRKKGVFDAQSKRYYG